MYTQMPAKASLLRQKLWRDYRALGRLLRSMTSQGPLTQGSFYRLRRKCGKAGCRCARGQLHGAWVLTRAEAGKHRLYTVPTDQRARLRRLTAAWRRSQRARARLVKEIAALLRLADRFVQSERVDWPSP
jgi:hypothetical protein